MSTRQIAFVPLLCIIIAIYKYCPSHRDVFSVKSILVVGYNITTSISDCKFKCLFKSYNPAYPENLSDFNAVIWHVHKLRGVPFGGPGKNHYISSRKSEQVFYMMNLEPPLKKNKFLFETLNRTPIPNGM